jgi:membrane-associated protease RseP (regulator of RpoE activity)
MPVLQVILILALLIFVHELGHFLAARLQGIYANRFSIGFGPVLWKYQGKQTEYALRLLPLGGFVGFPDDDPESTIAKDDPNLLRNRPIMDRAIVIGAGVVANLLFAYLVLVAQVGLVGIPSGIQYAPGVLVPQVMRGTPAAAAGLQDGDIILNVNQQTLPASEDATLTLKGMIESAPNLPVGLVVQRGQQTVPLQVTPEADDQGKGRIGVKLTPNGTSIFTRPSNLAQVFDVAAKQFQLITLRTVEGFVHLLTNFSQTAQQVAGPVAIVSEGAKIARADQTALFSFTALISINLAILNILPLPALDGGQLAFLLWEALLGKPVSGRIQESVMQTGLVLLLGLGVFLIIRDTANLLPK